jgi:hypothetical protein
VTANVWQKNERTKKTAGLTDVMCGRLLLWWFAGDKTVKLPALPLLGEGSSLRRVKSRPPACISSKQQMLKTIAFAKI